MNKAQVKAIIKRAQDYIESKKEDKKIMIFMRDFDGKITRHGEEVTEEYYNSVRADEKYHVVTIVVQDCSGPSAALARFSNE